MVPPPAVCPSVIRKSGSVKIRKQLRLKLFCILAAKIVEFTELFHIAAEDRHIQIPIRADDKNPPPLLQVIDQIHDPVRRFLHMRKTVPELWHLPACRARSRNQHPSRSSAMNRPLTCRNVYKTVPRIMEVLRIRLPDPVNILVHISIHAPVRGATAINSYL